MTLSPIQIEVMTAALKALKTAKHGESGAICNKACETLNISIHTFHRYKNQLQGSAERKRRSDKGSTELSRDEAVIIGGVMMESLRNNGKRLYSLTDAVDALRADGKIRAERVDKSTGELVPLSESAIHRALREHRLHPDQLLRPSAHSSVQSLHPNHVWQIDASLCVLYYLKPQKNTANGLQCMAADEFYKNKPKNLQKVMADRVWSYEITDHTSGWIYVEYVMGAESGENLCAVLINAMQERENGDVLHGVPNILYMDPGSANTSAMTKNLCKQLGIEAIAHKAGNARATGQVENARNIIERSFEAGLKFQPVADLAELNGLAAKWRIYYNAERKHRRHGLTRTACWLKITAAQLVKAPSIEVCRNIAVATPETRVVSGELQVSWGGQKFDVSHVPNVMVSEKLNVTFNSWRSDSVQVHITNFEGNEQIIVCPLIKTNEWGFDVSSPVYNEGYKTPTATVADRNREEVEQVMTGTSSNVDAEKARKKKALPLGGEFNPYAELDKQQPSFLPRRGQTHSLKVPTVETPPLNLAQAAKSLRGRMGNKWKPEYFAWLEQRFSNGVPEDQLDSIIEQLTKPQTQALKVVGGK
jgi:transposase InsO family protein